MLLTQTREAVLKLRTHCGFNAVTCVLQVTGTGKAKSNYEGEKKSVVYRQTEYIMKVKDYSWLGGWCFRKQLYL